MMPIGTIWSIRSLKELGVRTPGRLDWAGTLTFGIGLTVLLTGITYGDLKAGSAEYISMVINMTFTDMSVSA